MTPSAAPLAAAPALALAPLRGALEEHLPEVLLRAGPRGLLWWQWVALPLLVVVALLVGVLLGWITRRILAALAARTRASWDDAFVARLGRPLGLLWAIAVVTALHPWLALGAGPEAIVERVLRAGTYLVLFSAGLRFVDVALSAAVAAPPGRLAPSLLGLLPLGRKLAKVLLVALGTVAVLNELGFQVASLLAGLGIGGIALALAAQKTVENLFGSVAIGVDQPFRVGDFVKIGDVQGTVEAIGMRSTRIRTLDRTIVTLPNGKLADTRSETFAVRDRIRFYANVGLVHGTTAAQLRAALAGIEALLRDHPRVRPDGISVRFTELRESSLNVEIAAYAGTADWDEFTLVRQELLLGIMGVVERCGTAFAFPTRTVELRAEKAAGPVRGPGPP